MPRTTPQPTPSVSEDGAGVLTTTEWCPMYMWGQMANKIVVTIFVPCLDEGNVRTTIKPDSISL